MIPLSDAGLGQVLRANRRGALAWMSLLDQSSELVGYQAPELDIVTYFPDRTTMSLIDAASAQLFDAAADGEPSEQIHLATYPVKAADFDQRGHRIVGDLPAARILRSTVMKPESESYIAGIHTRLERLSAG